MKSYRCTNCNSRSFTADRALAGRLICNNCGTPLGNKRVGYSTDFKKFSINKSNIIYFILLIILIIIILF